MIWRSLGTVDLPVGNVDFSGSVCSEQIGNEAEVGRNAKHCGRRGAAGIRDLGFGYVTGQLPA